MNIAKLTIENFKLFEQAEFDFDCHFNLIIGENGSGKTSLLSAVAIAMGGWAHAYIKNPKNRRAIEDSEIREIQLDNRFDKAKKTKVAAQGHASIIDRNQKAMSATANWVRTREEGVEQTQIDGSIKYGSYPKSYPLNFSTLGNDIFEFIDRDGQFDLPLLAFYECNRLWLAENELNATATAKTKYSRFDPYVDCFHTGADHQAVGEWILKHELASLQQKQETAVLKSIKQAAVAAIEGCSGLKFDFEQSRILIEFENGKQIPFEHLSDGQRTMLGLFCDIARRAAILNPHLKGEATRKTSGIVLIDELDLHLHPKWQRAIIESLTSTFPNIQFICTTHSPFLIQSLRKGKLIQLTEQSPAEYSDISLEDIVENVQGVDLPQKSLRYLQMIEVAEKYYKKLEVNTNGAELEKIKQELDELMLPFSDDPAFVAQLKLEREFKLNGVGP